MSLEHADPKNPSILMHKGVPPHIAALAEKLAVVAANLKEGHQLAVLPARTQQGTRVWALSVAWADPMKPECMATHPIAALLTPEDADALEFDNEDGAVEVVHGDAVAAHMPRGNSPQDLGEFIHQLMAQLATQAQRKRTLKDSDQE